jgi:hypothetical protein
MAYSFPPTDSPALTPGFLVAIPNRQYHALRVLDTCHAVKGAIFSMSDCERSGVLGDEQDHLLEKVWTQFDHRQSATFVVSVSDITVSMTNNGSKRRYRRHSKQLANIPVWGKKKCD